MTRTALIAALAALAACGGGSGSSGSGSGPIGLCRDGVASGCTLFTDLTAATATIDFGGALGLNYVPKCIKVRVDQPITFNGDFGTHLLSQTCGPVDAIPHTTSGTTLTFHISTAGTYGYQCDVHFGSGMDGAIEVVP